MKNLFNQLFINFSSKFLFNSDAFVCSSIYFTHNFFIHNTILSISFLRVGSHHDRVIFIFSTDHSFFIIF